MNSLNKTGKTVSLMLCGATNSDKPVTSYSTVLATLPEGYRPSHDIYAMGVYNQSDGIAKHTTFLIRQNGNIELALGSVIVNLRYILFTCTFGVV